MFPSFSFYNCFPNIQCMKYLYMFCFLLLICSCHKENDNPSALLTRTLLIYLGGDNSLDAETYDKLIQIKNEWHDGIDGKIIVYQDTPFKDSPRLLEIDEKSEKGYITIHTYDQENSASPEVLSRVIDDVTQLYPAKSYGLLVFSHASGWLPPHTLDNSSRSIIIDNDDEMELTDFAMAIPDHLFNFIIFEACNMSGIEVTYELRNKAEYILASSAPIVSPGFTPVYTASIPYLFEEVPNLEHFAENYFNYWNSIEGNKRSATISLIKTAGLPSLAELVRGINIEISNSFLPVEGLQNYDGVLEAPFYFFDFAQYYQSLVDENTYDMLQEHIKKCVIYKRTTPFYATAEGIFPITSFSGITTYIMQKELTDLNKKYTRLQWYKDTN